MSLVSTVLTSVIKEVARGMVMLRMKTQSDSRIKWLCRKMLLFPLTTTASIMKRRAVRSLMFPKPKHDAMGVFNTLSYCYAPIGHDVSDHRCSQTSQKFRTRHRWSRFACRYATLRRRHTRNHDVGYNSYQHANGSGPTCDPISQKKGLYVQLQ